MQEDSEAEDEGDLGELSATLDKLRLFDASVYFGKGSMLFTSTDQNQFWDEEISFDVHDVQHANIPAEATLLPPIEVIDMLFDIYYRVRCESLLGLYRICLGMASWWQTD